MSKLVAIIEDEPDIRKLIVHHLEKANFNVKEFQNGNDFFKFIDDNIPDLIILDIMLPDADGFEICKYLKNKSQFSTIPIIILTAKSEEVDKVLGLELGADDYITKPFSPRELIARVKAVLRRFVPFEETEKIIIDDILEIDLKKRQVKVEDKIVELTKTEFEILRVLSSKRGWVFTRNQILDSIWGEDIVVLDRTIDVHIKNLRDKIGKAGKFIKNVRGIGYKFDA